ncbi:MAG: hypothetical protein QM765_51245 [Myxococcales bacterium]
MKRLMFLIVLVMGCGRLQNNDVDEFRAASPSRQGIEIQVPAKGSALESDDLGQTGQALLGDTATWYQATRSVTVAVNGGTAWVLALCEAIIKFPATDVTDTEAVWGPWTDSLSPNTYKFTVTKAGTGYDYKLEGKDKSKGDDAFVRLIYGHHEPGQAKNQGSGSFTADWDACQTLPEHGQEIGKGDFTYSRDAALAVTVGVAFKQVADNDHPGQKVDANYAFAKAHEGDGSFEFKFTNAKAEKFTIKSRWHNDGDGRSDVKAFNSAGTELGNVSECWGKTFLETYYLESWNPASIQGQETSCTFATAEFSTL